MKWFRKIKNQKEQEILQIEDKKEDIDFTDSMFSDIAEMKLSLENIKDEKEIYEEIKSLIDSFERYIEKASEIIEERKIEDKLRSINESNIILQLETAPEIPQSVQERVKQELTIEEYYKNVKAVYNAKYKKATQSILMRKAEKFNNRIDKLLSGETDFSTISLEDVKELETYYQILKQKNEEFTGIMQNKYVEKLIELQYKISIISLIRNEISFPNYWQKEEINKVTRESQTTKSKQIIWSRLFIINVENLISRGKNDYIEKLRKDLPKLNLKDNKEEILQEELLENYIYGVAQLETDRNNEKRNQEQRERQYKKQLEKEQKEEEEQKLKEQELKRLLEITTPEIEEKIKELDDDKFDIVTSYKSILDYQLEIARAKGLINDRNILKTNDLKIDRVERRRLPVIFANLKNETCNCEIYTDVDDSRDNVYIVTPKNVKVNLNKDQSSVSNNYNYLDCIKATNQFINTYLLCANKENKIISMLDDTMYFYECDRKTVKKDIKELVSQYKEENKENSKKVKFYIEMPYRRTIIPILEELQQNKIEFVIPLTDKDTKMNEPTVKIYMDRSDLEKYKENVHKNISTADKGIVKIGEEKIDIAEILIEGCDFSFLKEKER